jgi:hypothetical protein
MTRYTKPGSTGGLAMQGEHGVAGRPGERDVVPGGEAFVVDNVSFRVWMHESGTSAVAWFVDEHARQRRVALIARAGGGALTTIVPKQYEPTMQALGYRLWPRTESTSPPSGVHRIPSDSVP